MSEFGNHNNLKACITFRIDIRVTIQEMKSCHITFHYQISNHPICIVNIIISIQMTHAALQWM